MVAQNKFSVKILEFLSLLGRDYLQAAKFCAWMFHPLRCSRMQESGLQHLSLPILYFSFQFLEEVVCSMPDSHLHTALQIHLMIP